MLNAKKSLNGLKNCLDNSQKKHRCPKSQNTGFSSFVAQWQGSLTMAASLSSFDVLPEVSATKH